MVWLRLTKYQVSGLRCAKFAAVWLLLVPFSLIAHGQQGDNSKKQKVNNDENAKVERYLLDLDSRSFSDRQNAMMELATLGSVVIDPLTERARTGSVDFQNRAISVLHRLAIVSEFDTSEKAIGAIRDLSNSDSRSVAARASKALKQLGTLIQARLENKNITFYRSPYADQYGRSPITGIAFGQKWEYDKNDLEDITAFSSIFAATLDHPSIDNEDFLKLVKNTNLRKIAVRQARIDNQALVGISSLPNLQRLDIYYCAIDDNVFEHIAKCKNLATLKLIGTSVSDDGAKRLGKDRPESFLDYRKGGYLGVRYNRDSEQALLTGIEPNSAAEKAGLKVDDIIVSYNGHTIDKPEDLSKYISPAAIKASAKITVKRGDQEVDFDVKLGRWDIPELDEFVTQIR